MATLIFSKCFEMSSLTPTTERQTGQNWCQNGLVTCTLPYFSHTILATLSVMKFREEL